MQAPHCIIQFLDKSTPRLHSTSCPQLLQLQLRVHVAGNLGGGGEGGAGGGGGERGWVQHRGRGHSSGILRLGRMGGSRQHMYCNTHSTHDSAAQGCWQWLHDCTRPVQQTEHTIALLPGCLACMCLCTCAGDANQGAVLPPKSAKGHGVHG